MTSNKQQNSNNKQTKDQKKITLPLFYKTIVPLRKDLHKDLSLSTEAKYEFARGINSVPLVVTEFSSAQRDYPIFFSNSDNNVPLAALGSYDIDENLFVKEDGSWEDSRYLPIYIRRYPFFSIRQPNPKNLASKAKTENIVNKTNGSVGSDSESKEQSLILAVDDKSELFKPSKKSHNIFEGQVGSRIVDNALNICKNYASSGKVTEEFVAEIKRLELLVWQTLTKSKVENVEKTVNFAKDKDEEKLFSFLAVNPQKLVKLPDSEILSLNKKGFLAAIYAHLFSLQNWQNLVLLSDERNQKK